MSNTATASTEPIIKDTYTVLLDGSIWRSGYSYQRSAARAIIHELRRHRETDNMPLPEITAHIILHLGDLDAPGPLATYTLSANGHIQRHGADGRRQTIRTSSPILP